MVAVALTDGFANRMFQYAFGLSLKCEGVDVYYDNCHYKPKIDQTWEFVDLSDAFPNIEIKYISKQDFLFSFPRPSRVSKWIRKLLRLLGTDNVVMEPTFAYYPNILNMIKKNTLFYGYWQTELYFKKYEMLVRKQFSFNPFTESLNMYYCDKMKKENSVSIHVRKGKDYYQWRSTHGICEYDYYKRAINYIKEHVAQPVFYVFTDNPEWVRDHFTEFDYTLVNWNPIKGKFNYRDMQLMSCSKHNIIANSTYSWWGAWLNNYPNKIVVAPLKWTNGDDPSMVDNNIVPESWVKI